jgi:hypothetical protein
MQQVLSWRFLASVGAVLSLLLLWILLFGRGGSVADSTSTRPLAREIHLLEQIETARAEAFGVRPDGRSRGLLTLGLRDGRQMRVVEGTFGENNCGARIEPEECAVAANLIGDAVVWFALLPIDPSGTITFPAIDTLDGNRAQLINGWRLPFAPVLDRRCEVEFNSYREFRRVLEDRFTSIYSLEEERLTAVVCLSS